MRCLKTKPNKFESGEQLISLWNDFCNEIIDNGFDKVPTQTAFCRWLAENYDATVCDVYLYWKNLYSRGVDTTAMLANFINHPSPQMHEETARLLLEAIENI